MLELIGIFFTSFLVALSGALMPGPLLTVTITESAKRGFWIGPLMILGHAILEIGFILLILWGVGEFLMQDTILSGISFFGTAILLWMGIGMLKESKHITLPKAEEVSSRSDGDGKRRFFKNPVALGILISLSNPYWTVWWLTIGLAYIFMSIKFGVTGVVTFFVGHILADFIWYAAVSASVSFGSRFFTDRAFQVLVLVCGLFLVGFSFYFFHAGFTYALNI